MEGDDFHAEMARKCNPVRDMVTDHDKVARALQICFLMEPLDWLWQRVQFLDENSSPLWDLQFPATNPCTAALESYAKLLTSSPSDTGLDVLFSHVRYGLLFDEINDFVLSARTQGLTTAAQIHWRLAEVFSQWPYPLAQLSHPRSTDAEKRALCDLFFHTPLCCLDKACSGKLRVLFMNAVSFLADKQIQQTLRIWSQGAKLCNMHIERLFAQIRKACAAKTPHLERLVSVGLLTQTLAYHLREGGDHPSVITRSQLRRSGVAIAAAAERPDAMPSRARGHLAFLRAERADAKQKKGAALSAAEYDEVGRQAMASFKNLTVDEQYQWQVRAENEASTD